MATPTLLKDNFGRRVNYLRLSVTDRCDFRCTYCMAEDMQFLPRSQVLCLEELALVAEVFTELGVDKIRVTGGEPLIRRDILTLFEKLSSLPGLRELCLTTNASRLEEMAPAIKAAGVQRINISLDSLNAERFHTLTRYGKLENVLAGIEKAREQGFEQLKINAVLLKNYNLDEAHELTQFALERDIDISFIEEMPLGEIRAHARDVEYISSDNLRAILSGAFTLTPSEANTGGPSKYWQAKGYAAKIGFISPHSHNFCGDCNRVRVTASGKLLLCLGNEHSVDLRRIIRESSDSHQKEKLRHAILQSMAIKPERHEFSLAEAPQILRFMNSTGG